jgi:cytidylate kinase|tara:strand:- start:183 stop:866 length:684 start_codon:yes stop_codon:yes gene_type:complete
MDKLIIAIDGYAGTGKSSQAIRLAKKLNYTYIDTGAMYRAVTLFGLNQEPRGTIDLNLLNHSLNHINIHFEEVKKENQTFLNNKNVTKAIREPRVLKYVSIVAAQKAIRSFLTRKQQLLGKDKGVVIDGRDIGTVVFPLASCKFFLIAAAEVRAKRRYLEQRKIGIKETYEDVLTNITKRDNQDKSRTISPLKKAKDAIEIDVSTLNIDEVFHILYKQVLEKLEPRM